VIDPVRLAQSHAPARRQVASAIAAGRRPHAWLVTGEAGVGKRAFAEWIARAVLCDRAPEACGACPGCRKVLSGNHADLELVRREDGAQQITVAQVRERIVPALGLAPVEGRGRVVLIDEAHALNVAAQNALLKTLEEPPAGSLLLLVVERPDALLDTVRSRCQQIRLASLDDEAMRSLAPDGPPLLLSLARGRPGRLAVLAALDLPAVVEATDEVLAGRAPGTTFARTLAALCRDADADVPRDDLHEAALGVVHQRLRDHLAALAPGPSAEPAAAALRRAERAVLEAGEDLRRHVPHAVAWTALGVGLASAAAEGA